MEKTTIQKNDRTSNGCGKKLLKITGMVLIGVCFALLFALVFGFLVKWLWNYLMPGLFALPEITYCQAFALVLLAKLLFGAFGSHIPKHSHMSRPPFIKLHEPLRCHIPGHLEQEPDDCECFRRFWNEEGEERYDEYKKRTREQGI